MRIKTTLAGIALVATGAAALWGIGALKGAPVRWGSDGHRMAARAAHDILPQGMPAFFMEARAHLEYLSPEPDRWRNGMLQEMDEAWKYDHYIDLENVPPGALEAPDRFEFFEALIAAGVERPQQYVGFLPYRILEVYQRLASGFARWRVEESGADRAFIEARILNDAGILGHYAVDAAQPHHTTIHFNGWAEDAPNPRGYTMDRGFHSQFESGFVRAHVAFDDIPPLMPDRPRRLGDVREAIWDHIVASNYTVEELYRLEKANGFDPDRPPHPDNLEFAQLRLAEGAEMLASLWWTAWVESEEMAEELRARGWRP
jgi:hypothetical protein